MAAKIQSEITQIVLNDATYKGSGVTIDPTYINYFFGNNGTGKSTIAKTIKSGAGISYAPGRTAVDYLPLIYDQDYIDANMHSYHSLPGVFTLNAANVKIQEQIDSKAAEQEAARQASSDASAEKDKKQKARESLMTQFQKDCWSKTDSLRKDFKEAQTGFLSSKQKFVDEVRLHSPVEHDMDELKRMYDTVFSSSARQYDRFTTIADPLTLDTVSGSDILSLAIVNVANTNLAEFLKEIGAEEWVRQGHTQFHEKAGDRCPYCSRPFDPGFEKRLADSFDDQYERNLAKLSAFLESYKKAANDLFVPLSKIPNDILPSVDTRIYSDKLAVIKAAISDNIEIIKEKIVEPSRIVSLKATAPLLQELSDIITDINRMIDDNNHIVAAGPKKKAECKDAVFEHMAFVLKDVIEAYDRSDSALSTEIKTQQGIITDKEKIIKQLQTELHDLNSQTVETETAMTHINTMLHDSGFQGFELRPHIDASVHAGGTAQSGVSVSARNYEVVRTDTGEIAKNLSEGEKNFIAFLYFQQQVIGSATADGDPRQKIVVIDDPVSSMDSSALFIVSAQIRKMIEICRNNVDNRDPVVPGNFIKQIFILTHNPYFHREVTYAYANRYDFVSFYLIRKTNNKSSIRLCDKVDPDCPSERINVNPVKNSYPQ